MDAQQLKEDFGYFGMLENALLYLLISDILSIM